jgi:hypothetical protein
MNRFIQYFFVIACVLATTMGQAQNQVTYVYEDNSGNNGKVEWTRTMEIPDAEIGVPKKVLIPVKNISKLPLIIVSAKSHCGCTEANAPKGAIAPGATDYIEVIYTAKERTEKGKNGFDKMIPPPFTFYQIVDITTNFDLKNSVVLSVQGTVVK